MYITYIIYYTMYIYIYHIYACHLWGQRILSSLNKIQVLQNRALRKKAFKKHPDSVNPINKEFNKLQFKDLILFAKLYFYAANRK